MTAYIATTYNNIHNGYSYEDSYNKSSKFFFSITNMLLIFFYQVRTSTYPCLELVQPL